MHPYMCNFINLLLQIPNHLFTKCFAKHCKVVKLCHVATQKK